MYQEEGSKTLPTEARTLGASHMAATRPYYLTAIIGFLLGLPNSLESYPISVSVASHFLILSAPSFWGFSFMTLIYDSLGVVSTFGNGAAVSQV